MPNGHYVYLFIPWKAKIFMCRLCMSFVLYSTYSAIAMSAIKSPPPPPHVLIFPYPAQGHALSLLDLTHQLALHGLTITVLTTPKNLPSLSPLLSAHPQIQTLVLPFPAHPVLPPGVENVKELGNAGNFPVMAALLKLFDPIAQWFESHRQPPVAIISDFFLGWTQHLAVKLDVPRFAFLSVRALTLAVFEQFFKDPEAVRRRGLDLAELNLPNSPPFKQEHLPSLLRRYRASDPVWEEIRDGMLANMSSFGFIFNDFEDLEGGCLRSLKTRVGHERVYAVGPLSLLGPDQSIGVDPDLDSSCAHVFRWLDGCPDGSVVYVCFGSQKLLTNAQMEGLANGLERSMTRFVWVVNTVTTGGVETGFGAVPDRFAERVRGRGMVIRGWVPQVKLLDHPAVGGFLSHCGWNSLLEGVVSGAMIIAWPMEADQFVNARLLVEELGVGVRVCEGGDSVPDSDEMGRLIGESMREGGIERVKAEELKAKALAAVKDGGSSLKDLDRLIRDLYKLVA